MYQSHYNIAGISITITAPIDIIDDEAFTQYRTGQQANDQNYQIILQEEHTLPVPNGDRLFQNELNMVYEGPPLLHYFRTPLFPDICEWDILENSNEKILHYRPEFISYFENSVGVFNAAGIERILHFYEKYLYHCSYVDYNGRAVLFSAPSGGGKTTQGLLWEQYAQATMINGDRAVLEKTEDGIMVHGLPIAGSSNVFINRSLPLAAIFTLEKAEENSVVRLNGKEAVRAVYSQLTVNLWNEAFVQDALDFAIAAASVVPIYRLSCNISQEAVELAKNSLI